jgi:acetyl-CoA carboxylase carboxyltransferase component
LDPKELKSKIARGGPLKYHHNHAAQGKYFVRERIDRLIDPHTCFVEDGIFARCDREDLPADAVVTGFGTVGGQTVGIIANDATVKAGSWGPLTVEKILRLQEEAEKLRAPLIYLVDSAGARITDQMAMFPGKRGAGRIFYNQVKLSGYIPQLCIIFGPCAAGGAYIPAFCDITLMIHQNASMYLGSPRMVETVIGEKVDHESMGGAEVHTRHSGLADLCCRTEDEAIAWIQKWMFFWSKRHQTVVFQKSSPQSSLRSLIPEDASKGYDIRTVIDHVCDEASFMEIKPTYAAEIVCGWASLGGRVIGIVANQPCVKGGVLFCESAAKAARFVEQCHVYDIPLLFLTDVPGFMIGSAVEKQGIIRYGARMIAAISRANVPKICLILRKAYGAGLYAMCGPAFEPDCTLALPSAQIAVMGPEPAVNAVYFNHIQGLLETKAKEAFVQEKLEEYLEDIHLEKLASELIVDHVIDFEEVRSELIQRFAVYAQKQRQPWSDRQTISPM